MMMDTPETMLIGRDIYSPEKESPLTFIANRLRAIPLVSARMSRAELDRQRGLLGLNDNSSTTQSPPTTTELTSTSSSSTKQVSLERNSTSESPRASPAASRMVSSAPSIAKRDASPLLQQRIGDRIQNQSEVLFRRNGITASTANVMRKQTTTSTTRRPQTTTRKRPVSSTTSMRSKPRTTTSTTRRPTVSRQRQVKIVSTSASASTTTSATTITERPAASSIGNAGSQILEPITSYRASTLQAFAQSDDSQQFMTVTSSNSKVPQTTSAEGLTSSRVEKQLQNLLLGSQTSGGPLQFTTSPVQLTKATQASLSSTQPVNQRRQQLPLFNLSPTPNAAAAGAARPNYGSNRLSAASRNVYDNDPLRGAGERWSLFSRPDGSFSVFETVVLMSNILIVATVIFVILFNFIKSIRRKRAASLTTTTTTTNARQPSSVQAQNVIEMGGSSVANTPAPASPSSNNNSKQQLHSAADAMSHSRISMISSGVQSQMSGRNGTLATTTTTNGSQSQGNATSAASSGAIKTTSSQQKPEMTATSKLEQHQQDLVKRLDSTLHNVANTASNMIASEIKNVSNQVTNKAMAIVQPSAEGHQQNKQQDPGKSNRQLDELDNKANLKADLLRLQANPSSNELTRSPIGRSVSDLSDEISAVAKVAQMKEGQQKRSADDSTPISEPERVQALEELFVTGKGDKLKKSTGSNANTESEKQQQQMKNSDSLESIELPENLVAKPAGAKSIVEQKKPTIVSSAVRPSPNLLLGQGEGSSVAQEKIETTQDNENRDVISDENKKKQDQKKQQQQQQSSERANKQDLVSPDKRPENPMGRDVASPTQEATLQQRPQVQAAEVKNHQVVVNKLDKRKTNLEIVDLRDESVTGKMRSKGDKLSNGGGGKNVGLSGSGKQGDGQLADQQQMDGWISMDGVAVVQAAPPAANTSTPSDASQSPHNNNNNNPANAVLQQQTTGSGPAMSPSELIESRFHVDYASGSAKLRRSALVGANNQPADQGPASSENTINNHDSLDSKQDEYVFNNIENELEQDNKMRNRKYFVYIVHDGHFTAKKECIARIELPPKRRITLAELRQLISSSQDISLSSLRRNRFKFVTETYRLLNENEDAAVLHQVYPTQGVFLKLNVTDNQDTHQTYPYKGGRLSSSGGRLSSGASGGGGQLVGGGLGAASSSLAQTTIASRRRANARSGGRKLNTTSGGDGNMLPAIEVDHYSASGGAAGRRRASAARASSVGRTGRAPASSISQYGRSKSSVQTSGQRRTTGAGGYMRKGLSNSNLADEDKLPQIGRSQRVGNAALVANKNRVSNSNNNNKNNNVISASTPSEQVSAAGALLSNAASDLGANMISGAKKLFSSTFSKK